MAPRRNRVARPLVERMEGRIAPAHIFIITPERVADTPAPARLDENPSHADVHPIQNARPGRVIAE